MGLNFRILSGFIVAIISFNHLKLGIFYLVKKKISDSIWTRRKCSLVSDSFLGSKIQNVQA